jgi:hypothetical protein
MQPERVREARRAREVHLGLDPAPPRSAALHGGTGSTGG